MAKTDLSRISREAARIMGPAFLVSVSTATADAAGLGASLVSPAMKPYSSYSGSCCMFLVKLLLLLLLLMWHLQVAYMDPGNWATAIEAGSRFGYQLVSSPARYNIRHTQLSSVAAPAAAG